MAGRGIDMEALSPRDANALPKRTTDLKAKAAAQLKTSKDKDHPPPPPPQVIEPSSSDRKNGAVYQVGKLLGKGGFAICYDGKHVDTGKRHALKIVKSHMPVKMQQKFQTELQIHSKMRQRNIVQFHRAFTFESCTYLVLELCPNGSLMEMVKKRKGLTEAEVRFYAIQVAGAIKYMHKKGIIHRDLKMGNIFLDKQMNAKVGDFGLAALLVTGDEMQTIRRTTLCGTPNYIAPEILQKGKAGHDHMVDIWSLGIIIFAMLTTKPPFQSSTTDEIYRRARELEYDWPENDQKRISPEAKSIVSSMLVDADKRPDPDLIVQHDFFRTGYVPAQAEMLPKLRETAPQQEIFYDACQASKLRDRADRNLLVLCQECNVGPWHEDPKSSIKTPQIWREMTLEEKHGLTPSIPLAVDIVYRPYDELRREQQHLAASQSISLLCEKTEALTLDPATNMTRVLPQSFAAQQRAASRPQNTAPASRTQPSMSTAPTRPIAGRARSSKKELPLTTSGALSLAGHEQQTSQQVRPSTRTTRMQLPSNKNPTRSTSGSQVTARQRQEGEAIEASEAVETPTGPRLTTLFDPHEPQELLDSTRPDVILSKMRNLQRELQRALNSRSQAFIDQHDKEPATPKVVVKWVDYSNKFGVGYILNDGSAGCVLNSVTGPAGDEDAMLPPTYLLVRGTEKHISRRQDLAYRDRQQIVPMTDTIYFYELHGEEGVSRTGVDPEEFRVGVNPDGTSDKLGPGKDVYNHRKRERVVLWKKFANYMLQYGRDPKDIDMFAPVTGFPGDLVTFYQRFGDVGVWCFCDGHLQFNFPDHTKIVLDSTGKWCHFWHLSEEAAERLTNTGELDESSLDNRAVLSYPLQTLLNFTLPHVPSSQSSRYRPEIPKELQRIPEANGFRLKMQFIFKVVKEWVNNGGMGMSDMSRHGRLMWNGTRQTKNVELMTKHVWVTVGARGQDSRHAVWVDCRNPTVLLEDIDENKRSDAARKG